MYDKISPMIEMDVHGNGRLQLPAEIRNRWNIKRGAGAVRAVGLNSGILIIPDGTHWGLIENFTDGCDIFERAKIPSLQLVTTPYDLERTVFVHRRLSSAGEFTIPDKVRKRMNIQQGDAMQLYDLNNVLVIVPTLPGEEKQEKDVSPLVEVVFLRDEYEPYNQDGALTTRLRTAYRDWQIERAENYRAILKDGGTIENTLSDDDLTELDKVVRLVVSADMFEAARELTLAELP